MALDRRSRSELRMAKREFRARLFDSVVEAHFSTPSRKRQVSGSLLSTELNILGVGIGEKISEGKYVGVPCLSIHVRKKMPRQDLPRRLRIPKLLGGLTTDVLEVGRVRCLAGPPSAASCLTDPTARQPRPVPGGVSISGGINDPGTLGYLVRDLLAPGALILSNFHVLGDLSNPQAQPDVRQPGNGDGGDPLPSDVIGRFVRGVPLDFNGGINLMDAAVAAIRKGTVVPFLCAFGPIEGGAQAQKDDVVAFFGRTSRYSKGVVKDIDVDIVISGYPGKRAAAFADQIYIRPLQAVPFARRGDSGAVVLKGQRRACALLFASDGRTGGGYATPLLRVLRALDVAVV